jgi:AcrR family transcriptional regulator
MAAGTRDRIVGSSAELFRRQGYAGTGIKQILAVANAPFGSLYHFFPGGKEQLGAETIRSSGRLYIELFATIAAQAPDVPTAVGEFFGGAAETLEQTDYADACPIATVALEVSSTNEQLREACAEVFESWIAGATQYFAATGIPSEVARELALSMLCLLEGAFVFCRAMRSTEPLRVAGASAVAAATSALADAGARAA